MKFKIIKNGNSYVARIVDWFYTGPRVVGDRCLTHFRAFEGIFNTIEEAEAACFKCAELYRNKKREAKWKKIVKF